MNLTIAQSPLRGEVTIPGSKSHTIRAVVAAALATGESKIRRPLESMDAEAVRNAYTLLGAEIEMSSDLWRIQGTGGTVKAPDDIIHVENSGTTMRMVMGSAALLQSGTAVLTGDAQVRSRPCGPLAASLNDLGAQAHSTRNNGCPPMVIKGRLRGGETEIEAVTSQYVSSLLMNAPLAEKDTRLRVPLLNEKPYVMMTLSWLERQGIEVRYDSDLTEFHIPGGQQYAPVDCAVPADFSSAAFFLAAGALPGNKICSRGLDKNDTQGDKAILEYLKAMGAEVKDEPEGTVVSAKALRGCEFDLNDTPDALPIMAALACFAEGTTRLVNVPQARLKETDRIRVMREELEKLGAAITEFEDGMMIEGRSLHGGKVNGHGDHRIVMALTVIATAIPGLVVVQGAEAVNVTYPRFFEDLAAIGGLLSGDAH